MLKKYICACLLGALALFTSCSKEDIGNYNYHDINEVKFSTELSGKKTAFILDRLVIKPTVNFTQDSTVADPNRYSYEWVVNIPSGIVGVDPGLKTLAKTKDLNIFMNLPPSSASGYECYYRVTDNVTGIRFDQRFFLEVRNVYNEGFMLMTDVNGKAQLDMLSKQVDGTFLPVNDILGKTGSALQLTGKPRIVFGYDIGNFLGVGIKLGYGLYLGTDQSIDRVHPETFEWKPAYSVKNEVFDDLPADFHVDFMMQARGDKASYMISSTGDVYYAYPSTQIKYSTPLNYAGAAKYKVAPFIGVNENWPSSNTWAYFYDMTNKRFMGQNINSAATLTAIPDPTGTNPKLFSYTNTGKDLLYMTYVSTGTQIYAILKDPATQKIYLARFRQSDAFQLAFNELISTDIDKAEHFAVSPSQGYIYYNVGGKVYQYDYNSAVKTKLVLDKGAAQISLLKFHNYQKQTLIDNEGPKLLVCSYDPALPEGQNGKIEQFNVLLGATGIGLDKTYTGFGKVVSLHYRER